MHEPLNWGRWTFNRRALTLDLGDGEYEVDLERCNSSAEVLDWICQVAGKSYVNSEDLGDLVLAINDLLRPQAALCSWGVSHDVRVTRAMLLEREQDVIAERVATAAEEPSSVRLGEIFANHDRALAIVKRCPRSSFDDLVRAYQRESVVMEAAA